MGVIITKKDIVEKLSKQLKITKTTAKQLVNLFYEEIACSLELGVDVKISGFGNFELKHKNARCGRNFKTGQLVPIVARRMVKFKAGKKFKSILANYTNINANK